jgi:signal recognition particle subunit SRP54
MFDSLSQRFTGIFDRLKRKGLLSEQDVDSALREIRLALLEADVALPVAKEFVEKVRIQAIGAELFKSVSAAQLVIKIVNDVLVETLGNAEESELQIRALPTVILMAGLQGSGKTTTTGKLAHRLQQKQRKKVLMASLDIYRPAAQKQLEVLGTQNSIATLPIIANENPAAITARALEEAKKGGFDVLLLDTAGRLHIDDGLMHELQQIKSLANPHEVILVADAMTGQDAVRSAEAFHKAVGITGVILTRMDGDSRGGAALSLRMTTGQPIKFLGLGEKIDEIEPFDPKRIANRMLDMGDIVSLVERAAEAVAEDEAARLERRMQKGLFSLNDLATQLRTLQKMGGVSGILTLLPGVGKLKDAIGDQKNDRKLQRMEAIIRAMTPQERKHPEILNASRKRRIASGSGVDIALVNTLLKQHLQMAKMVKKFSTMDKKALMRGGFNNLFRQ